MHSAPGQRRRGEFMPAPAPPTMQRAVHPPNSPTPPQRTMCGTKFFMNMTSHGRTHTVAGAGSRSTTAASASSLQVCPLLLALAERVPHGAAAAT